MQPSLPLIEQFYSHSNALWDASLDFPNTRRIRQFTHRIFNRYPARSISLVPRSILEDLQATRATASRGSLRVLDPFLGSGTTAVEAALQGMLPYGVELDPFARLISEVRVRAYSQQALTRLHNHFEAIRNSWQQYSPNEDLAPQLHNIDHWFDEGNFKDLLKLKQSIYEVTATSNADRDFLRVVLADIIRPCSKAERQTLKPYISKKFTKIPAQVDSTFQKSFQAHFKALEEFSAHVGYQEGSIQWLGTDGREFESKAEIDVAITSPPYINALDYVRCIKLESAWIDCGNQESFNELRRRHIGDLPRATAAISPPVNEIVKPLVEMIQEVDPRRSAVVAGYFQDMYSNLRCTHASLKPGAEYHVIVGNCFIRQVYVPTHEILAKLGESVGFKWKGYYKYRIKDHRTSIPRGGNGGKIDVEHVITLRKD
jgi:DNA modification methylase